jgi:ssDNA-binding Zn-finger/Zn-ribbon topoisomerase 1
MKEIGTAGTCPKCNEELIMFRSNQGGRFIKCSNEDCKESYPIPRAGTIEYMGITCPSIQSQQSQYPILMVKKKNAKPYFWVKSPCFGCSKGSSCTSLLELREEFNVPNHL